MIKPLRILLVLLCCATFPAFGQADFRVMFYNIENLFDTEDNPKKNDNEFLPEGSRKWTKGRYTNKINNLTKVISDMGEWDYPALVGLCEVENAKVLKDLTVYSSLRKANYRYIIGNSPDERGINTALLYQRDKFKLLHHRFHKIKNKKTRDILHATGVVISKDTLDIFVCHYPSRRGGATQSESARILVSKTLKQQIDSLQRVRKSAHIIIMGDFNDEPSDKSLLQTLGAVSPGKEINPNRLYNLFFPFEKQRNVGTHKYQNQWCLYDQIIVSGSLLENKSGGISALPHSAAIFKRDYMLVDDVRYGGKRPKRTYFGYKHEGGFSDHLPVFVDLIVESKHVEDVHK